MMQSFTRQILLTFEAIHRIQGRGPIKSKPLNFSSQRKLPQAIQKPPDELDRILSGKHGRLSAKTSAW